MAKPNLIKFKLKLMGARVHEYVDLMEMMPQGTLHGVGVITKQLSCISSLLRHLRNQLF